jgi:hypothetical protein
MRAESERRQIAWQIEKTESTQRHDFELNIQRKDLEEQLIMEGKQRKDAEKQVRITALDKAKENGDIGEQEYEEAILTMEVGPQAAESLFGKTSLEDMSSFSERGRARTARKTAIERAKPENVSERLDDITKQIIDEVRSLDPATQQETHNLLQSESFTEASGAAMLDTIKAKKDALALQKRQGITGGFAFGP